MKRKDKNHKKLKPSFAVVIGGLCLGSILMSILLLSLLSTLNYRDLTYNRTETYTTKQVTHIQDQVNDRFRRWVDLMAYAAIASAPFMSPEAPDTERLQ
ncbi:MAG: hypothetical protein LBH75_00125, partial [Treponema sp.]|nr:hypothetical protein [Treponema sp.]